MRHASNTYPEGSHRGLSGPDNQTTSSFHPLLAPLRLDKPFSPRQGWRGSWRMSLLAGEVCNVSRLHSLSDTSTWQGCLCREAEHARFTISVLWLNYPYGLLHLLLCCPRPHDVISSYSMFVYYSPQCDHVLDLVIASQNPLG